MLCLCCFHSIRIFHSSLSLQQCTYAGASGGTVVSRARLNAATERRNTAQRLHDSLAHKTSGTAQIKALSSVDTQAHIECKRTHVHSQHASELLQYTTDSHKQHCHVFLSFGKEIKRGRLSENCQTSKLKTPPIFHTTYCEYYNYNAVFASAVKDEDQ